MTRSINDVFCRRMLASAHANIKRAFPDVKVSKAISGVGPHGKQYFIQIDVPGYPAFDNYYSADSMTHAKAEAWMAFFNKYAPDQIKREVEREDATS